VSDIGDFISELGAGVFEEKVQQALKDAGYATMAHAAPSEITIKLKISPASKSQAKIVHSIVAKIPQLNGEKTEKNTTHTIMYVGEKGKLSIFPENQTDMFTKRGAVAAKERE
jgi:hypothetical protein